jgi:aspartate aminotransferase
MVKMKISDRVLNFQESVTLKLNAEVVKLQEAGQEVINLTAGQLPFKPDFEFIKNIKQEANFLKSFQYSPVAGFNELRLKIKTWMEKERRVSFENSDVIISSGAKHVISNVLCSLINPGDEVVVIAPYWVSYPAMIELYGGKVKVVKSDFYDHYCPDIDGIKAAINNNTKAIIINSPNNHVGTVYKAEWMDKLAALLENYPDISIISDEIYKELNYYDPEPSYFYQSIPSLLNRTIIISGISKVMASTGLRIGWAVGPKQFIKKVSVLQGQTTSGANSLIQLALMQYDFDSLQEYLNPIKNHLRKNANILRDKLREKKLSHKWYQVDGAFYYLLDLTNLPIMDYFEESEKGLDCAEKVCQKILSDCGVALVPGGDFGAPNTARLSLVANNEVFAKAIDLIIDCVLKKKVN